MFYIYYINSINITFIYIDKKKYLLLYNIDFIDILYEYIILLHTDIIKKITFIYYKYFIT